MQPRLERSQQCAALAVSWILAGLIGATLVVGGLLLLKVPAYPDSPAAHYTITKRGEAA